MIDDDLGRSRGLVAGRSGFAELAAQVGLGQVGIVLSLECSRLARNNSDWYRLLDLAGMTDTLIADTDGVYHPGLFNDRLLLGMKGTMSEAELHILRARLDGGIRNKAARGELRSGLPVGLVWGEADGQIRRHPDEAVSGVIAHSVLANMVESALAGRSWAGGGERGRQRVDWPCSRQPSPPRWRRWAGLAEHVGASVGRVGQHVVHRVVGRLHPRRSPPRAGSRPVAAGSAGPARAATATPRAPTRTPRTGRRCPSRGGRAPERARLPARTGVGTVMIT